MKKDDLITLGLTTELADKVMAQHTEEMKGFIPRSRLDEETGKVTSLTSQLADRDKDIKTLQSAAGKGSDLEKQLTELQTKYTTDTAAYQKQLADQKLDAALDAQLMKAKARDPISVKAHIKRDALKLKDDGSLEGLDLTGLVKERPYLFEVTTTGQEGTGFQGGTGNAATEAQQLEAAIATAQKAGDTATVVALKRKQFESKK